MTTTKTTERLCLRRFMEKDAAALLAYLGNPRVKGCFKEFISFVNNPDGTPKYEDTCIYAVLEKEWLK